MRWEYAHVSVSGPMHVGSTLNRYGRDGWEVVGMSCSTVDGRRIFDFVLGRRMLDLDGPAPKP